MAMVKSDAYFNKLAIAIISHKSDKDKLTLNFSNTVHEAREWLSMRQVPQISRQRSGIEAASPLSQHITEF